MIDLYDFIILVRMRLHCAALSEMQTPICHFKALVFQLGPFWVSKEWGLNSKMSVYLPSGSLGFGTICVSGICNLRHAAPDLRIVLLFFKHLSVFCCFHFLVCSNQSHCPCWWEVWTVWCCQDNISSQSSRGYTEGCLPDATLQVLPKEFIFVSSVIWVVSIQPPTPISQYR